MTYFSIFLILREIGFNIPTAKKLSKGLTRENWKTKLKNNLLKKIGYTDLKVKQTIEQIEDKLIIKERDDLYEIWYRNSSL